jgi:hypothetical protein
MVYLYQKKMKKVTIIFLLLTQVVFGKVYTVNNINTSGAGSFKSVIDSIHAEKETSNVIGFVIDGDIDITNIDTIKTNVDIVGRNDLYLFRTSGTLYFNNADVRILMLNTKNWDDWNISSSDAKCFSVEGSKIFNDISINNIDSILVTNSEVSKVKAIKARTVSLMSSYIYGDSASVTIDSLISGGKIEVMGTAFGHDKAENVIPMLGHALAIKNSPEASVSISSCWFMPVTPTSSTVSRSGKSIIVDNFGGDISISYSWFGISKSLTIQSKLIGDGIYVNAPGGKLKLDGNVFYSAGKESYCIKVVDAKDSSTIKHCRFGSEDDHLIGQEGRGMYLENFNNGVISNNTFCGSLGINTSSDTNVDYESGLVLLSSSNNFIYFNSFGVSYLTASGLIKNGNNMNGIWLGNGSANNLIKSNFIGANKYYGIKDVSGGANKITYNYISCNDSGSFKVGSTQETLDYFNQNLPVLVVDGSGKSVNLSMNGMPVGDGSKIFIYEKLGCSYNSLGELMKSFIDSVTVSSGAFSYNFPSTENLRSTTSGDSKQYYIMAAQPTGESIGISKESDIITHSSFMIKNRLMCYPNPVGDILNVVLSEGVSNASVSIVNQAGQVIISQVVNKKTALNVSGFSSGMYQVKVVGNQESFSNTVFIK